MIFSSILFLFRFMPVTFIVYYLTPRRYKNFVLFLASMIFYSWGEVRYFPIMLASVAIDYISSNNIEKHRGEKSKCRFWLGVSMVGNMGMLLFFKYTDFFLTNINGLLGTAIPLMNLTLPLGISFYTFQTMSYTIDVYRNRTKAEKNLVNFATFVVLFPQLIAGPIVRYTDISRELAHREMNPAQIEKGVETFIWGLGRKVLLANGIGSLWSQVKEMPYAGISTPLAWLGILAFALQIYFDFSGYSLMAIGLGRMLGFEFPQNFNNPYISKSATEFWRRWHMTLGSWFREYLYIPLGGNRCGRWRQIFNIFVVWAVTGLWHGANWNFVLWGIFFFVLLVLEKTLILGWLERHPILSRCYILPLLLVSWAIFDITDFGKLGEFLAAMFSFRGGMDWLYYLRNYGVILGLGILFSTPVLEKLGERVATRWQRYTLLAVILVTSIAYLVDATYNPFLYFRF